MAAPPPAPPQIKHKPIKAIHCQVCRYEPDEPEALEPEESPDECPGLASCRPWQRHH